MLIVKRKLSDHCERPIEKVFMLGNFLAGIFQGKHGNLAEDTKNTLSDIHNTKIIP
jgi:hypothetical protein